MQRVPELVEERPRVVPADEDGLAGFALHEVGVVGNDHRHVVVEVPLAPVLVHPRAGSLSGASVRVEVPEANVLSRRVRDPKDADVRVVDGDRAVRQRRKAQAEELPRNPEHALPQLLQLQVRLHVVLVQIVLRLADPLRIEAVVPGRDADARSLAVGDGLHVGDFLVHARHRRLPHRFHQPDRALRRLGHRVLQPPVRVRRIAEKLGALCAELEDLRDGGVVVARAAVVAAHDEHPPHLLAQVAAGRQGQERIDARTRVDDGPLSRLAATGGRGSGGLAQRGGQPGEIRFLLEHDHLGALLGEEVLAELRVERGELLVQIGKTLLGGIVELRAGARERRVVEPEQPLLLRIEAEPIARLVHRGDAREEPAVLEDLVVEGGELRCHLGLDGLDLRVVHRRGVDAVDGADPIESQAGPLHRDDGVLERRGVRALGDAIDLLQVLGHCGFQRRCDVLDLEFPEGRDPAVRARPGHEQRIVRVGRLGHRLVRRRRLRRASRGERHQSHDHGASAKIDHLSSPHPKIPAVRPPSIEIVCPVT